MKEEARAEFPSPLPRSARLEAGGDCLYVRGGRDRAPSPHAIYGYFFTDCKRLLISSQLTTFHQACRYSGRRLLYFR